MTPRPLPLPAHLRRRPRRRSKLRRLPLLAAAATMALVIAAVSWRVDEVRVHAPEPLRHRLENTLLSVEGTPWLLVDLDALRHRLEAWPGVAGLQVGLEPPSRLTARVRTATPVASLATGAGWHGVAADGRITGRLPARLEPVVLGASSPEERRRAVATAHRLAAAAGGRAVTVRRPLPGTYRVELTTPEGRLEVLAEASETPAEGHWRQLLTAAAVTPAGFVDLRMADRLVLRPPVPGGDA